MTQYQFDDHTFKDRKPVGCYVYVHLSDEGVPYYVGKGTFVRAWLRAKRSKKWVNFYKKRGLRVSILKDNMTSDEAYELEVDTIRRLKEDGLELANITSGGLTPSRYRIYNTESRDARKIPVYRSDGIRFGSITEAAKATGLCSSNMITRCIRHGGISAGGFGWSLHEGQAKPPPPDHDFHNRPPKKVMSDVYGEFESFASAKKWLRLNGYPRASHSALVSCCKGKITYAYGSGWSYC